MYTQFLVRTADPSTSGSCLFLDPYVSFLFLGGVFLYLLSGCHWLALLQWFCLVAHGNWSPWSGWGICSRSCNGGQMRRYRTCDNPRPANGGRACGGPDSQIQRCNTEMCPGELSDSCRRTSNAFYVVFIRASSSSQILKIVSAGPPFHIDHSILVHSGWELGNLAKLGSVFCFLWRRRKDQKKAVQQSRAI